MEFKIYTNALKAYENESGERFVAGTTSSTIRDLHGDEMSLNALKSMADTARQNMTVFLNHNYNVPEDLFGSAMDAQIVKRFDSETGQEVYDLDLNIRVVNEDENPEALRAYRAIKRGVKLGLSIGARVEKASRKAASDGQPESIVIEKVRLMEASVVGIPANQRSYLHSALKSIKSAGVNLDLLDEEELAEKASPDALTTGDFVTWGSGGGPARGRITKVVKSGKVNVPDSEFTVEGTPDDPAALIRVYRKGSEGWAPSETIVGHKFSTLRKIQPLKDGVDFIDAHKDDHFVENHGDAGDFMDPSAGSQDTSGSSAPDELANLNEVKISGEGVSGEHPDKDSNQQESNMDSDLEKKTRVTVTVSTDGDEKQPAAPVATADSADQVSPEEKDEVKASASPEDTEPAVEVEEDVEAEEPEKDPSVEALEALGATLVEAEKSIDGENESSVQPEVAEAEVVAEVPVEEAPAAENVEADAISSIDEVKSIAKSALDAANAAHEEVAAIAAKVTELAESKAKVEEDLSKALELIERISALGVGRKSYDRPQEVRVKSPELAPWLSPYVQRVLEAQDEE